MICLKAEYLDQMDRIAEKAGTREPDDVLDSMGCIFMDPGSSVDGFVSRRKGTTYYGVSRNLTGRKYDFGVMHEGFHIVCRHLDLPGFLTGAAPSHVDGTGSFTDSGFFTDCRRIAGTERDANIGAADFIIDTETILEMLGYDNADVAAYRKSTASFEQALRDYNRHFNLVRDSGSGESRIRRMQDFRQKLTAMYGELQKQAQDICNSGVCLAKNAIAREFGVPEFIIDYKLEALLLRNYRITAVELPPFDKVFSRWN